MRTVPLEELAGDAGPVDESIPTAVAIFMGGELRARAFSVEEHARFQACSISKPVGAVTALCLVAEGRLGLDDDIGPLLTSWSVPEIGGWRPTITLRQLLTHSAGLTVHGFPGYPRSDAQPSLTDVLDGRGNTPAVRVAAVPGLQARYSGGGYVLLEVLLEDLTGRPYADLAAEHVLRPAGMRESGFDDPPRAAPAQRADGQPVADGPRRYPALVGGLWTTPADLVRFALSVQRGNLLPAGLQSELLVEHWPGWGLGFQLRGGGNYFGHGGANEGYRCRLVAATDGSSAAAVMTGSDAGGRVCGAVLDHLAAVAGWPSWEPFGSQPDLREWTAELVGDFIDALGRTWSVRGDARAGWWLALPGQRPLQLEPTSPEACLIPALDAELRLEWAASTPTAVELHQSGVTCRADRAPV